MFTEDYVLRLIAQATAVVAKVIGLSKAGQFQEAYQLIDQALEELLGLRASLIKQMDETSLISLLTTSNSVDTGRLSTLADLFRAEGDVLATENRNSESQSDYLRALNLYLELAARNQPALETGLTAKINEVQQKLNISS